MKNRATAQNIRTILFIIAVLVLGAMLAACSSAAGSAGTTGSISGGKVVSISKDNIPLSGPQASELAKQTFENGSNIEAASVENGTVTINANLADKGIIGIRADVQTSQRLKVKSSKDGTDIYYNVSPGSMSKIPMQMGNGRYSIEVYENISGTNYKQLYHKEVEIYLEDPNSVFLYSNQVVDFESKGKANELALALTKDAACDADKIKAIYDYVTKNIRYDSDKINTVDTTYTPDVDAILSANTGICYDYAAVMAAMLREVGVPTKLDKGYRSDNVNYHAWNEVYLNGQWVILDTTFDAAARQSGEACKMEKDPGMYTVDKVF